MSGIAKKLLLAAIIVGVALVGFVGGLLAANTLRWAGAHYCVDAQYQMIANAAAASEDKDPRECLIILHEFSETTRKRRNVIGFVHANLVQYERAMWDLPDAKTPADLSKGGR